MSRLCSLLTSDFSARLRHYLQSDNSCRLSGEFLLPVLGLEVTLDKDHGNLSLVGTQGEGGRD